MTLFFILLIALVVYQFTTRKSLAQIYPQFDRSQIRRLTDAPFYVTGWALLFILVAYGLSALTAMIGELFNVDNYIAIFSGGWLGLILQFLRSNGFIGDIQEPMVLLQYRDTISTICSITLFSGIICGVALFGYCRELKKTQLNKTVILTYNYLSMACGLTSFLLIMWGLYEFNDLLNHAVDFHMEEIYLYLTLFSVGTCGITLFWERRELKKLFDMPQCESLTWQQVLAKMKINTDKGQKQITEGQIVGIAIGLSILITGCVILSTLPVSAEPEQNEATYSGEEEIAAPPAEEQSVVNHDEEDCIAILQKYYTASNSQIQEWGGKEAFETARFIKYTSCWDSQVLTSNQDFGIGDDCLRVGSIVPNSKLSNSYIVSVSCGYSEEIPTCVVMAIDGGQWKIDNISMPPYNNALIDYSRPASDYYAYPDCGGDVIEEPETEEIISFHEVGDIVGN